MLSSHTIACTVIIMASLVFGQLDPEGDQSIILNKNDFSCDIFGEFTQLAGRCCNRNLDCQSLCCLEKLCVVREPCPHYDGSIELWEEE